MIRNRRWLALLLVATLVQPIAFRPAAAQPRPVATSVAAVTAPPTVDTRWGVLAAMGCGLGIRFFPAIAAAGAGAIAGVVAVCMFMVFDGWSTPDSR